MRRPRNTATGITTTAISAQAVAVSPSAEVYMKPLMSTMKTSTATIGTMTSAAMLAAADRCRSRCSTAISTSAVSPAASSAQGSTCTKSVITAPPPGSNR